MDLKLIEKLMSAMGQHGMKRLSLKQKDFELELEKEGAVCPRHTMSAPAPAPVAAAPSEVESKKEEGGTFITSPMVGTYYCAPSPDEPPFVSVGDSVELGAVVCIVEAMKVMNEVKAGVRGTVAEVLLKSGDPVEFGTKLFRVT